MNLDDFIEKERKDGKAISSEASFTLDPNKVRERVASFCRTDGFYPLWRIMQAIVSVCRGDIFIHRQKSEWQISFKWPDCPPSKAFTDLLDLGTAAGFDQIGDRAAQHLFFGLSAALGTSDYQLTWSGPSAHFQLSKDKLEALPTEDTEYNQVRFAIDAGWWSRLLGKNSDAQLLDRFSTRLCYSPKSIHLERQLLEARAPTAPEKPWGAKLVEGSELAWRFLRKPDQNFMQAPYPELDLYRASDDGSSFHLIREPEKGQYPLSVVFHDPLRKQLKKGQTHNLSLSQSSKVHSGIFLNLEAGRQDWFMAVSDGVLTEALPVDIAGGGICCLSSEQSLNFDLSGLKVVQNENFQNLLAEVKKESKALKRQLALSVANIGVRAKNLPRQYDQAVSYLVGGPLAGLWGGRFGPKIRRMFRSK